MGWSFSDFVSLGKSTYQNTKPVADALISGMIGQPMANTPTISAQGTFANTQKWYQTDLAKDVGSALVSRALQGKPQAPLLQYSTQTETNDANLMLMRQRAEEAGFNPLTVLRAGGINAYATRKTNIPSYAPQLSSGPSYLAIAAGATAQSYFNRPTEQQKASSALKIAQQYADLDYTRTMTDQARNSGADYKMSEDDLLIENANRPVTDGRVDEYGRPILIKPTESIPKWVPVIDQVTGVVTYIFNPELTESGPVETATGWATIEAAEEASRLGLSPDHESVVPPLASQKHKFPMKVPEMNELLDPIFQ